MKLFAVLNHGGESDFDLNHDMLTSGSNDYPGGAVILAVDIDRAKEILQKKVEGSDPRWADRANIGTLIEIELDREGVVMNVSGDYR